MLYLHVQPPFYGCFDVQTCLGFVRIRFKAKLDYNQSVRLKVHLSRFTSGVFVHGGVAISYRHHNIFSLYLKNAITFCTLNVYTLIRFLVFILVYKC